MATPRTALNDPVKVDSKHYKVEFESNKVRVLRTTYGPHEKSVMHAHPDLIAVILTDAHARFTLPDGKTEEVRLKAGQVLNFDAMEHLPENLGNAPLEAILVELKA